MAVGVVFTAIRPPRRKPLIQPLRSKLDRFTRDVAREMVETLRRYPPVPADSSYVRTYDLHAAWDVIPKSTGARVHWIIQNNMPYANLVYGPRQWWAHKDHGWKNIQTVADAYARTGRFQAGAQQIIDDVFADWITSRGTRGSY